jgi:hypothetical protein
MSGVLGNRTAERRIPRAVLQRFLAPDSIEKLQGDETMRATNPKPTPTRKPNLQVIPGALSLYREGDVITFDLNDIEFEAPIDFIETEDGSAVLHVVVSVGVYSSHVKRVERRAV